MQPRPQKGPFEFCFLVREAWSWVRLGRPSSSAGPTTTTKFGSGHSVGCLGAPYASASVPQPPTSRRCHSAISRDSSLIPRFGPPPTRSASHIGAWRGLPRGGDLQRLLDYAAIHSCLLRGDASLSLPLLALLLLLLHFRLLAAAAGARFTPAVSRLAPSPSMAAVTLLALGNGAPDAFASATALGGAGGMPRAGLTAILSAGAFVVDGVALIAAPLAVPPASFARDLLFYLLAASGLFYIYLSAEIFLCQPWGSCSSTSSSWG